MGPVSDEDTNCTFIFYFGGLPRWLMIKNPPANARDTGDTEMRVRSLGQENPLEKEMTTHASILFWKIPWTKEPGGLQSMGSQRIRHD